MATAGCSRPIADSRWLARREREGVCGVVQYGKLDNGPTSAPKPTVAAFRFDNSFARELQGFYVPQQPAVVRAPRLLFLNDSLAEELGLDLTSLDAAARAAVFAGNTLPEGAEPLAQAYAGHQFGGFSPQLGDGRALLLGEVIDRRDTVATSPSRARAARHSPAGRRQGRRWPNASRGAGQRGNARARHSHDARSRGRGDRRAGVPRTHSARRSADTRGGEPHPRRDLRVLCFARRRGTRAQTRRVHDRAARSRARDHPRPSWRCCGTWPSVRLHWSRSG